MLSDHQFLRYGRQMLLPGWGEPGQRQLAQTSVAIIGLGGLGVPVLANLAGCGVGRLLLLDGDTLSLSNLHRQWIYRRSDVGQPKARLARRWALGLNPEIRVEAFAQMADEALLHRLLAEVDLVLDCTDTLESRQRINRVCVRLQRPLVSAAAIGWQGQLQLILPGGPCFACFCPEGEGAEPMRCSEAGVAPPVVSAIGALQATLALKWLLGEQVGSDQLHRFDGRTFSWRQFTLAANPHCPLCGEHHETDY
ncbi:HesA/MoeB/ThiF family protein [Ferrimonas sediminicola]|uniref:HesA/MoeB/ThiF family protein n=1 Tax=Ferrimonas sediminicola TaxID=2569538 RepID=A0A4U1BHP0_9GAMM|nr:HesA/MoeB/ThiF family protein [Ferrimonas sediminicola]TKB50584.1 HesA/MoeB/ThiF family protein [Ferrimonas sediminicola]